MCWHADDSSAWLCRTEHQQQLPPVSTLESDISRAASHQPLTCIEVHVLTLVAGLATSTGLAHIDSHVGATSDMILAHKDEQCHAYELDAGHELGNVRCDVSKQSAKQTA